MGKPHIFLNSNVIYKNTCLLLGFIKKMGESWKSCSPSLRICRSFSWNDLLLLIGIRKKRLSQLFVRAAKNLHVFLFNEVIYIERGTNVGSFPL